jgi:acetyl-CoA decarbonylase/synthase complex subunit delta
VASTPIDVNLAKQLNILLGNLGVQSDKILIDPTTGGLGYGLEYSYSVMERIRMAALTQEDDKLQIPMISNIGNEIWKCKEAGQLMEEAPTLGDPERRGILMETVAAVSYLLGGADVVILRHPESVRLTRSFIELLVNGGMATDVGEISKQLELKEADLISLSPEPDLTIAKEKAPVKEKAAKPEKKEAPPKPEKKEKKPKAVPKPEEKVVELRPKTEAEEKAKIEAEAKAESKAKAEAEAKARAEAEAKARAEEEAKARAEEKAREEAERKAKAKAEAKEKEKERLQALRYERGIEREKLEAERTALEGEEIPKTPAAQQKTMVEKLIDNIDRIHRRI